MQLKKLLIKNFIGVGAMKLLAIPVGLLTSIILARTLGPESFGQYSFVMALVPLFALPVSGGLPQLLTREVASFVHSKDWTLYRGALRASHLFVIVTAFFIVTMFWLLGIKLNLVNSDGKWSLLSIALLMVPITSLSAVRTGTIKGLGLPAYAEIPGQLIQPLVLFIMITILTWYDLLDIKTAIWSQITGAVLIFLIASCMFYKIQPVTFKDDSISYQTNHWLKALLPFTMLALSSTVNAQVGIIVLGLLSTDEQVSAMRVAERGGQFVVLSLTIVNMVIAPYIVKAYKDGNKALMQNLAKKSARGSLLFALPVGVVLIGAGEWLIRISFGEEYSTLSYVPLVIIVVGQLLNVFFGSVGHLLSMTGNEKYTLTGQFTALLSNILLCMILIPTFGAVGAAISVSVSIVLWNSVLAYYVLNKLKIRPSAF